MKIEFQVCSLEQAKRLKELGIEQNSFLIWMRADESPAIVIPNYYNEYAPDYEWATFMGTIHEEYAAFTVAELGVMLPDEILVGDWAYSFTSGKIGNVFNISYMAESETSSWNLNEFAAIGNSEAENRATMLIYLLENKLATPEQCNNSLNQDDGSKAINSDLPLIP